MKCTSLLVMITTIIGLSTLGSCKKESSSPIDQLSALTKEVITKPSLQEMRQGQAMLSAQEREQLWKTKLNFILSNRKENLTFEQRQIISEVRNFLTSNGMKALIEDPAIGIKFLDEKLSYYSKHFSKEQLNILLESPYLNDELVLSNVTYNTVARLAAPEGGSCTCLYDMGCPGSGNNCENTGCTRNDSYEMCGMFGTSSCTRRCSADEPNLEPDPLG